MADEVNEFPCEGAFAALGNINFLIIGALVLIKGFGFAALVIRKQIVLVNGAVALFTQLFAVGGVWQVEHLAVDALLVHAEDFGVAALGAAVLLDEAADEAPAFLAQLPVQKVHLRF